MRQPCNMEKLFDSCQKYKIQAILCSGIMRMRLFLRRIKIGRLFDVDSFPGSGMIKLQEFGV